LHTTTQMDRISSLTEHDLRPFITQQATEAELQDYWGRHAAAILDLASEMVTARKLGDSLIILLPGLMGSTLEDRGRERQLLWMNPLALVRGHLNRLDLADDGMLSAQAGVDVGVRGLMWLVYAKMLLRLQKDYEVHTFPYDWRMSTWDIVPKLNAFIQEKLAQSQFDKVTLIGHSLGGLLAMDFLIHPTTCDYAAKVVKRSIMLGAPFKGALPAVTFLTRGGQDDLKLKIVEGLNNNNKALQMLRSFPSMYQILPAPHTLYDGWNPIKQFDIWKPETWSQLNVPISRQHLERALAHHQQLAMADPQVDVFCIAGALYNTPVGLDGDLLGGMLRRVWDGGDSGDGTVAVMSAQLANRKCWFVHEDHTELVLEKTVIEGIIDWVEGREPARLVKRIEEVVRNDLPMRGAPMGVGGGSSFVSTDSIAQKALADIPLDHDELAALAKVF
jgi:pimeloyl-ACP methyl ester carboxylesterase